MKRRILIKHEHRSNHCSWYHNQVFATRRYYLCCGLMQNPGTIESIRSRNVVWNQVMHSSIVSVGVVRVLAVTGFRSNPSLNLYNYYFHVLWLYHNTEIVFTYFAESNFLDVRQNSLHFWTGPLYYQSMFIRITQLLLTLVPKADFK